jgi:hypothetical protein
MSHLFTSESDFGRESKEGQFTWEALDKVAELSTFPARKAS